MEQGTMASNIDYKNLSESALKQITGTKDKVYSVTELEDYAKCPYMYFAKRILHFGDDEEEEMTLKPLEKGNLLHSVLFKFYTTLKIKQTSSSFIQNSSDFKPSTTVFKQVSTSFIENNNENAYPSLIGVDLIASDRDKYLELLHNLTREELEIIKYDSVFFAIDEIYLFGIDENKGILEKWLDNELAKINEGWKYAPVLFELSFGGRNDAFGAVELSAKLHLKGKIDRIEVLETHDGTLEVIISDYKLSDSSSLATNKKVEAGLSFQMPLYMLAIEQILKQYYDYEVKLAGAAYYILDTKYKNVYSKVILTHKTAELPVEHLKRGAYKTEEALEATLVASLKSAEVVIKNIEAGNFPVRPINKTVCEYCAFKSACRINEKTF